MKLSTTPVFAMALLFVVYLTPRTVTADWTDGKAAVSVIGQETFTSGDPNKGGAGPTADSLSGPQGIARDPATGKVFVCDTGNYRVLRFSSANALATGADAEAVFGQQTLLTSDFGQGRAELSGPTGAHVDSAGRLWVADSTNNRVVMYENAATKASGSDADGLLGATTFAVNPPGLTEYLMYSPQDVATDASGSLWVADWVNNRVLRFDNAAAAAIANANNAASNTAPADGVLGQANLSSGDANRNGSLAANTMEWPYRLAVDDDGNLWVTDWRNNRILYFVDPASKANGENADGVLGTKDFVTKQSGSPTQDRFWGPHGITVDSSGALWVTEEFNHRVVRFDNAAAGALANAADTSMINDLPDGLLGQELFTTFAQAITANGLVSPWDVMTSPSGSVWVVNKGNGANGGNRVTRYEPDASSYRSDGLVGLKKSRLKGNNVYNTSGSGQKVTGKSSSLKKQKFYAELQNDGDYTADFTVKGIKGNRDFKIKYFRTTSGKVNITGTATGSGYKAIELAPGGKETFLVEVKPKGRLKNRAKSRKIALTMRSDSGGQVDKVKITAKKKK